MQTSQGLPAKCTGWIFVTRNLSGTDRQATTQILAQWAGLSDPVQQQHQQQQPDGDQPGSMDQPPISGPSHASCRFEWGDFAALSYVWGSEHNRRNILLNGAIVSVTANLGTALRTLAKSGEFHDHYKLWIDAICINQADEIERASEVGRMRHIYSGSWAVVAWLGESDARGGMREAFQFLRNLASLSSEEQSLSHIMIERLWFISRDLFFALHEMMTREYWSRLWIVQEIVMGASSTVLRCGNDLLDWKTFSAGIAVLYSGDNWNIKDRMLCEESRRRGLGPRVWQTLSLHLVHQDLRPLSKYEEDGGHRLGFRRLLEIAISANCRDTRDKAFSLVGMMDATIANEIMGDYSLEPAKLFAGVAKAFIRHYENLEP